MFYLKMPGFLSPSFSFPHFSMPDFNGIKVRLWSLAQNSSSSLEWSTLTRRRSVDIVVGMTLHCLIMSLHVILLATARAARCMLSLASSAVCKMAAILGLVRPLRLVKDTEEVRQQLESATVLRIANYNLVLFEGLSNRTKGE